MIRGEDGERRENANEVVEFGKDAGGVDGFVACFRRRCGKLLFDGVGAEGRTDVVDPFRVA